MNSYVKVIDLTSKTAAQEEESSLLKEPDPKLDEAVLGDLSPTLQEAVSRLGWNSLMPVQAKAIPYMLAGRDIIVQSKTGSGKTGAFLLPLFEKLDAAVKQPQALILTPTRELARQIFDTFSTAATSSDLGAISVYGGVGYGPQIQAFKDGVQLVVGTPGRVLDHLAKGTLKLDALRVLVLDEADEMLSVGFWPAMKELRRYLPRKRESYMFSATMPYKVQSLGEDFLHNPGFLSLGRVSVARMTHQYAVTAPMDKNRTLVRFIELENPDSAIVFVNTKRRAEYLTLYLRNYGFDARSLSGDLSQRDRERVMGEIRSGSIRFLVATDVAARGIDISDLSHILMYDVPQDPEYYVHRAGRTARAGKAGRVIALATVTDEHVLKSISKRFDLELEKTEEPSGQDVETHVQERVIELLEARLRSASDEEHKVASDYVLAVKKLMNEGHVHWLSVLFDEFYHQTLHSSEEAGPSPLSPEDPVLSMDEIVARFDAHLAEMSNVGKERIQRFADLVAQLIREGEPELPAMLLAGFCSPSTASSQKRELPKKEPQKRRRRDGRK